MASAESRETSRSPRCTSDMMTIPYPRIAPEIFRVGPIAIRWYSIMYIVGYVVGAGIARRRVRRGMVPFTEAAIETLIGYLVVGMLLGARLVYVFVYDRPHYAAHPLDAFAIWHGGLSFHGAVLGMTIASAIFARRQHIPFWTVADTLALAGDSGIVLRPAWQLHQWRALRARDARAVGDDLSDRSGAHSAAPVAVV